MPRLSTEERNRAIGQLEAGVNPRRVAYIFNVHISTIYRLQHHLDATNTVTDRSRPGRPRVTTPRQDRYIRRRHRQEKRLTATSTAATINVNPQRRVGARTVRRRLTEAGLLNRLQLVDLF